LGSPPAMANPEGHTSITGTARLMPATFYIATTPLSGHTAWRRILARNRSGPTSRRVTGCRTAAIRRAASCVFRMRPRPRSACRGDHSETLTLLTWPDVLVRIAEPGPASLIQVGSDAKIRRGLSLDCHFLLERVHEKCVELRGFEPMTSCMPYRPGPSPDEARRRSAGRSPAKVLARCGLTWPGACDAGSRLP